MSSETLRPHESTASSGDSDRKCPYCRSRLVEGEPVTICGHCESTHHRDCWNENRGCATVACEGGPPTDGTVVTPIPESGSASSMAPLIPPPAEPPATPPLAFPGAPPASRSEGASGSRTNGILIFLVLILLLLAVGGGFFLVSDRGGGSVASGFLPVPELTPGWSN